MDQGLQVRQFDPRELEAVSTFLTHTLTERYRPEIYRDIQRMWPEGFLVVDSDRETMPRVVAVAAATFPRPGQVRVLIIAIEAEYRRQGLGTHLLFTLLDRARAKGAREACLEVQVGSPAIQFYQRHGFDMQRVLPLFYQNGSDGLLMVRQLE